MNAPNVYDRVRINGQIVRCDKLAVEACQDASNLPRMHLAKGLRNLHDGLSGLNVASMAQHDAAPTWA
jgi:hypothetical protein